MNMQKVTEVTEDEETAIRDDYDEFILVARASYSTAVLHLPEGGGPLCGKEARREVDIDINHEPWKLKETAIYPPGHKDICSLCAAKWREQ